MHKKLKLVKESEAKEYRYITNHGIGPGTLPDGVYIRSEDLDNGKTAIYLNRPLTDEELKKYDIKPEWIQESTLNEDLKDKEEKEEEIEQAEDDLEDTLDSEEDQEENPVEEESELDKQLDELRKVLVDLDLNLYQVTSKEDPNNSIYIIGKVAEDTTDTLMLIDTKPEEHDDVKVEDEPIEQESREEPIEDIPNEENDIVEPDEKEEPIETEEKLKTPEERFDFIVLPKTFAEINELNPRYGEELTPDHEAIMDYLMNCLIEMDPEAAEEVQDDLAGDNLETPEDLPLPDMENPNEEEDTI